MSELLLILFLVCAVAIGWHIISIGERALNAARNYCAKMDVQFLDDSVSPNGYGLKRNKNGTIVLVQRFTFEFSSTGERRYEGRIHFTGTHLTHIELDPHLL